MTDMILDRMKHRAILKYLIAIWGLAIVGITGLISAGNVEQLGEYGYIVLGASFVCLVAIVPAECILRPQKQERAT